MSQFYFYTEGLTVGYNGVPLIKDIKIQMKKGEILTLIGPNGAGKTTILKSVMRQLAPIAGTVFLDNQDTKSISGKSLSQKMSVVLTGRVQTELMTCEDVVGTGRYPYTGRFGLLSEKDRKIVKESMELIHISELADRDFTKISDGQKQRVMLARAICQEPEVILLDEPTSFLDIKYKLEFLSILQHMARTRNLSVIMSLHELDLAERISDKILCVKGDRVDRIGPPEEIFQPGYIPSLYNMTVGSYDTLTGNAELEPVKGEVEVFVIAGGGSGTPVFRQLQRAGTPFAAGILWENDLDYPAAKALASQVISEKPFRGISESSVDQAKQLIRKCRRVICAVNPEVFKPDASPEFSQELKTLYDYSVSLEKLHPSSL
ncbi:ABC transporter ATP-binding protein [bacterium 210820-DFI.6.37]|nr:ABC transporter ATP-binding protein [bacterium 210820-DFI.6.37]